MDPFVVEAAEDAGSYRATATLAGTRIRTELKDVGSAISVVTAQFLQDTAARNSEDLLVYTTNTEVGGIGGNFVGAGNGAIVDTSNARLTPNTNTRIRGLGAADNTRDFFLTDIPWDSYIVGRVDLQRGPNSILFGMGRPAGIINSSINAAAFKDSGNIEARLGSYGSYRASLDFNKVILDDELAVRIALLRDKTYYQQDPAFNDDKRYFGALRWDPKFLNSGSAHTSFRANYEHGEINANRPRTVPPIDNLTPWFTEMNQAGYDPRNVDSNNPAVIAADPFAGATQQTMDGGAVNPNFQPWLGAMGRMYENAVAYFPNPNSGQMGTYYTGQTLVTYGISSTGAIDGTIGGQPSGRLRGVLNYADSASYLGRSDAQLGVYKANSIQDASLFDFYNLLIDGPNKREWQWFDAYNVALSQTFFDNRLGVEAVYDKQLYEDGRIDLLSGFAQALTVDVNRYLPDGTPNPNFGRPCVVSDSYPTSRDIDRDALRITGFGELNFKDFMDDSSALTKLLGRHVFTGLYSKGTGGSGEFQNRTWTRYSTDDVYGNLVGFQDITSPKRIVATVSYLGPSLINPIPGDSGLIGNLKAVQAPTSGQIRVFDSHWNATNVDPGALWTTPTGTASTQSENPANYRGWTTVPVTVWNGDTSDVYNIYTNGQKSKEEVTSKALVWQGFFWDGVLVPTVGWRKDEAKSYSAGSPPKTSHNSVNLGAPTWVLPDRPNNVVSGNSTSWSIVLHTPAALKDSMPGNTDVSLFYNKSDNFTPQANRVDVMGDPIGAPAGETTDYGVAFTTLDDRLTLKITKYKTSVTDDGLAGINNTYMVGAAEAWGYMFALRAQNFVGDFATPYAPGPGQTQAQADAEMLRATNAFLANPPPDRFAVAWQYANQFNNWRSWMQSTAPAGLTVTGDTESKGTEYEMIFNPVKNWNISLNASKTSATRLNMAESFATWVEDRWAFYSGDAGLVRLWGYWYNPGETVRGKFEREFMSGYRLYRLQEGSDVPELRPWRANLVTNYTFLEGALKGINVGGSYRWQDKIIVGYPVIGPTGARTFDLENPYYGPAEKNIDLWVGYERRIAEKYKWRVQLNLRNVFADKELIPVTVQPDGSPATVRIPEATRWTLTNTFSF